MKDKIPATKNMFKASELSANYMHVEPNSHFYTDLEHIKHSLELGIPREEILIGIKNTIKLGYKITEELDCE